MADRIFDFELEEGADFDDLVEWAVVGLTLVGATAETRISIDYGDDPILTLTNTVDGAANTIRTQLTPTQVEAVKVAIEAASRTEAKYQTEITFSDGIVRRFSRGAVTVDPRA